MEKKSSLPLQGLKVLELASFVSGPFCGMILADMGAEVTKVENPLGGDPFRGWGGEEKFNPIFLSLNKNKKSITLDLKKKEGLGVFLKLIEHADVLIENFRPSTVSNLGIDYERLASINPRLVYCRITGFGAEGPYAERPAYDTIGQASSGLLSLLTDPSSPTPVGSSLADHLAGIFGAIGVLGALRQRETSGRGQLAETSLLQACVYFLSEHVGKHFYTGEIPTKKSRVVSAQAFAFTAGDKLPFVIHLSSPEKFWNGLVKAVGEDYLRPDDPRFNAPGKRRKNYDELYSLLQSAFATRPREFWLNKLLENDVPSAPLNNLKEVFEDPQVRHLDLLRDVTLENGIRTKLVGSAVTFSDSKDQQGETVKPAPELGEQTLETLNMLGYSSDEIAKLRESKAI
ncbi:MAG: CaiB/BaiF CoA transferase family protein [Nitrososphaerales archaeon]